VKQGGGITVYSNKVSAGVRYPTRRSSRPQKAALVFGLHRFAAGLAQCWERGASSMDDQKFSRLKRPRLPMPDLVKKALLQLDLMDTFRERPAYQQNDYIMWITRAKRQETIDRRLAQMLDEVERGDLYMKMAYRPKGPY